MAFREFDGELDAPSGFVPFDGELDPPKATFTDNLRDAAAATLKIGPTALKSVGDIAQMFTAGNIGSGISGAMDRGMQSIDQVVGSEALNQQKRNFSQAMSAPDVGVGDFLQAVVDNPRASVDQGVATVGSMFLPAGAAKAATLLGAGAKAATAATIAANTAMNAADTYTSVQSDNQADKYKGAGVSALISLIAGGVTGGGAEGQIARRIAGDVSKNATMKAATGAVAKAMGREGAQEGIEEVGNYSGEVAGGADFSGNQLAKRTAYSALLGSVLGGGVDGTMQFLDRNAVQQQPAADTEAILGALEKAKTNGQQTPVQPATVDNGSIGTPTDNGNGSPRTELLEQPSAPIVSAPLTEGSPGNLSVPDAGAVNSTLTQGDSNGLQKQGKETAQEVTPINERVNQKRDVLKAWLPDLAWSEEGGKVIRKPEYEGDPNPPVVGRTQWVPKDYSFDEIRKDMGVSFPAMQKAVTKALNGGKLSAKEQSVVNALMDFHDSIVNPVDPVDNWTLASQEEQDARAALMDDINWHELVSNNATTDEIAQAISSYYEQEHNANTAAEGAFNEANRQAEGGARQDSTGTQGAVRPGDSQGSIQQAGENQPSQAAIGAVGQAATVAAQPVTSNPVVSQNPQSVQVNEREGVRQHIEALIKRRAVGQAATVAAQPVTSNPVVSQNPQSVQVNEREGVRQHIEALIKRRAAANQMGNSRAFDNALAAAKALLNGEDVKPAKFKNAASTLGADKTMSDALFSRSPMKSVDANIRRGEQSMNEALISRHDVSRAMYNNELGWIDFVWGDDNKGIQHIIRQRMRKDGMSESDVYRLLTDGIVNTIASGETLRRDDHNNSSRVVIRFEGNEAVLVQQKGGNGWLLTGFELVEPMNQGGGATDPGLRSNAPIRSRSEEVAALDKLSSMAESEVNGGQYGSDSELIRQQVDAIKSKWANATEVIVVEDMNDPRISKEVREENDRQLSQGAKGQPEAFFDNGKVYIVASEMNSSDDVLRVLLHESLGHYGLRGVFGTELTPILKDIIDLRRKDVEAKAKQYGLNPDSIKDMAIAAEEVLAEMAQTNPKIGFVKRAIAAIRTWLRSNIPGFGKLALSDDEIIRDYLMPARRFVQEGKGKPSGTVFSRSRESVTDKSKSEWRDELGNIQAAPLVRAKNAGKDFIEWAAGKSELTKMVYDSFKMAPPKLQVEIRKMKAAQQKALEIASDVSRTMNGMTPEDRALVSDVVEKMVKSGVVPPENIVRTADKITEVMDQQTDELVKLGMLSKDAAERWRGKYLPRFYNRSGDPALDTIGKRLFSTSQPVRGMGGNSLKGRGVFNDVPIGDLQKWESLGWEVRDPLFEKRQGKLELKSENPYLQDPETVRMWRDWTPGEREDMGEIRDSMFRFAMGYTAMQNDIALGKLFDSIAKNSEWVRPRAEEGYLKVPDSDIPETGGVKRYGNLAGLYVRSDIFSHLTNYDESSDFLKIYRKALGQWKMGKTALNPVTHTNNIVSNFTMAHFAGVSYWDAHKYVGAIKDFVNGNKLLDEANEIGLLTGDITRAEIMQDMPQEIRDMMNMQESTAKHWGKKAYNLFTFWLTKPLSTAYKFEDDFFKYLIYKEARQKGMSPEDSMVYATQYIFNYDDLPAGARRVRDYAVPFFSYTYKAVPALIHTATHYPWRFAAPAAVVGGYSVAVYSALAALVGAAGDEWDKLKEEDQSALPPWMQGKSIFMTDKTIRLKNNDEKTGLPMFWDISRFMPGGDMFDVSQGESTTLPAPLTPSHPILTTISAMLPQINRDMFTGKDVVDKNDTAEEVARKRAGWLLKTLSPAVAPTGYHADRLLNALANGTDQTVSIPFTDIEYTGIGKDGLPVQPKYAALNTVGIKIRPIDLEQSLEIAAGKDRGEAMSVKSEIRQAARLLDKGAITQREYDRIEQEGMAKIEAIINKD